MEKKIEKGSLWAKKEQTKMKKILPLMMVAAILIGCTSLMMAAPAGDVSSVISSILDTVGTVLQDVYTGLLGIVTILAVVICAWCFMVKMFSKNQRSIEEANQWIKRVCIAWICFMLLSIIVGFGLGIVGSAGADTSTPWA